ncbi:bifunctional 2',3'-cyclic-nucleotide 2'-phosphodiesterase/3'-nucleotidase [Actibacterium sp. XHP0104]|uniref:bifunctional 2',3'-cyclic-nucleotide 2'-phosphodiesterase/3'-nucleotidase n=1 Tax=Actibacterium sp. XHP0104 TaxID=2984335 RepID=UPI0021E7AA78|nr:bifunctional 2',3'-cyclic-nucleotide 2'-phosphodiesterase/3'-nucleotidase [Actibacterium sp. XHP0104]MCV2882832.1 bifunctional 2',3'-cyclic-nucleotide 2'-phosphodiesterase/3'-nucleotidase [Actibacterium sp. XHP0104]
MNRRQMIAGTVAGTSLIALHPFSARASANQAHLRIMETTDLHVHVYPYDYYADKPVDTAGLARTATHIDSIRAESHNSLLVDNGDFLQGNPMGDYVAYERGLREGDIHPVIAAMNAVGFDAATLGNHEFNYGLDFLLKALAGANFPVVSANVLRHAGADPTRDKTLVPPYVILDRQIADGQGNSHPIRIGLIGFAPPQIMTWDRRHLEGRVETRDILQTARAWIPQIREQGADLIIALSHSGIGGAQHSDGMENASVPLAALDGIDAVMTGHSHLVFPSPSFQGMAGVDAEAGTLHGKPATMGGFWGSHLGVIDLLLEREAGEWRVLGHSAEARPIYERNDTGTITALVDSDTKVLNAVARDHSETLSYIRRPVGRTATPLHSYFALVADDPSLALINAAQQWHVRQMMPDSPHPILSAAAPFKAGGRGGPDYYTDIPAGDLAIRNVADLYLFPNTLRAVRITGAQLRGWLERSAGLFHQVTPGQPDQPLIHPDFPSYNFDVINGIRYEIDLAQPSRFDRISGKLTNPEAWRITALTHLGKPVQDDDIFLVATNNYRAGGGGNFAGADGTTVALETTVTNRDIIVRYIADQGTVRAAPQANWRLAPLPGTSVLFETGPGAVRFADTIPGLSPAGPAPQGFHSYRLAL